MYPLVLPLVIVFFGLLEAGRFFFRRCCPAQWAARQAAQKGRHVSLCSLEIERESILLFKDVKVKFKVQEPYCAMSLVNSSADKDIVLPDEGAKDIDVEGQQPKPTGGVFGQRPVPGILGRWNFLRKF